MRRRYETHAWALLVKIQNSMPHVDILTITEFMNDKQFYAHLEDFAARAIASGRMTHADIMAA